MERAAGIEPASLAWKAKVLPLHNARVVWDRYSDMIRSSRQENESKHCGALPGPQSSDW